MVFPVALALMAAGGYRRHKQNEAADERQAKIDADADEERQYRRDERARMAAMRKDVADAAAPLAVETPWQPTVDDEGNAMPQAPALRVGMQRFDDPAAAQKAADAGNAGPARTARMAAALEKHGEYGQAAQIRGGARQEEMAGLQLDRTKKQITREEALLDFGRAVAGGDWAGLQKVYERYNDGNTINVQQDGKGGATLTMIGKDGKPLGTKAYASLPDFMADAYAAFDPEKWIGMQDKKAETARLQGNADRDFRFRETQAAASASNDAARLALERQRVGMEGARLSMARMAADRAGQAAEPKPMTPDSTFDADTAADIAKDQVQKEADAARDGGKTWTAAQIAKRTDEIVQSLRQVHAARFVEETVARSLGAAQADPQKYAAAYGQAVQLGMPQQRLAALGFRPPATAQAAPQAQPAAPQRATMGAPAQAAPAAPAAAAPAQAAPPKTGVDGFADMLSKNITTPQGKALIGMHVRSRLPAIQTEIASHEKVIALPMVSGPVKEQLKAKVAALAQEAEMMQAFAAGNPGI